jgi:DivIVA domain-containing protein
MTDETFRLTALDVRRYDFGSALRGYDKARVDQFREQVAMELERLARVNQELDHKARNFHEQLRAFRDRDRALNEALISAQQIRESTRETAEREAASRHAEEMRGEVRRLEEEVAALDRAHRTYLAQLRLLAERQIAELSVAEERTLPPVTRRERLAAPRDVEDAERGA